MDTNTLRVRPFADADYPRYVEIGNAVQPDLRSSVEEARHDDEVWDTARFDRERVVAEDDTGRMIGWGDIAHMPHQFHPRKFWLRIQVDPPHRRRGAGTALFDALLAALQRRAAVEIRAQAQESAAEGRRFLERRGFVEAQRSWESRLDVAAFDDTRFAGAAERVTAQGVALTTLAVERAARPAAVRAAYELHVACERDMPNIDPTTPSTFDHFLGYEVDQPSALPDGYLLATADDRYVGQTTLFASAADPGVLYQGLTGVLPAYRGRGIALALKLRTIAYARERGDREIRTWNNARNRPMLRLNEALGFAKQPAWVIFQLLIEPDPPTPDESRAHPIRPGPVDGDAVGH